MGKYKNLLIIIFIAILGGAAGVFFKIGIEEIPPDLFTFLRFVIAYVAFIPLFLKNKETVPVERKRLILISLVASLNVIFFIFELQHTTATISGMMYASAPLLVGIFSLLILKEKISSKKWLGIIIGFVGLSAIILGPTLGGDSINNGTLFGNLIIWLAVISFSLYSVLSKKYQGIYTPMILPKYLVVTTIVVQSVFLLFHPQIFLLIPHIS